jgi:hypothetical protein
MKKGRVDQADWSTSQTSRVQGEIKKKLGLSPKPIDSSPGPVGLDKDTRKAQAHLISTPELPEFHRQNLMSISFS